MPLTSKQLQDLKAKAHSLKPIVYIGNNGFSETVKGEIERALYDHELIKIRIHKLDRELRKKLYLEISEAVSAEAVQLIGAIAVLYRKSDKFKSPSA